VRLSRFLTNVGRKMVKSSACVIEENKLFQLELLLWKSMVDHFEKCVLLMLLYTASAVMAVHGVLGRFMRIYARCSDGS
jgi:hypothetical protein